MSIIATTVNTTVSDVLIERESVSVMLAFTASSKGMYGSLWIVSRMRSNTTIVSCTEKPMIVRIAVMKARSTSVPRNSPRSANSPRITNASWSTAITAAAP